MNENDVNTWADSIAALPDKQFFNIMRLYLGEIKTPFNKHRLTQQLASFIRKPENTKSIITLLDSFDIKVLTAISLITNVTQESLTNFFANTFSLSEIFTELLNLKERLIIYSVKSEYNGKEILYINPLLEESIKPYLDLKQLFPIETVTNYSMEDCFTISSDFLAAFITYIKMHKLSCKADGLLKKNDLNRLEELFPGKHKCLQLLTNAFINLSIAIEDLKGLKIDNAKLEAFAQMTGKQQYAFLCAASVSRFSREGLRKEAQLLLDCINSIPETGYTTQTILWLVYLAGSQTGDGNAIAKSGRFNQLLMAARPQQEDPNTNVSLLDRMIDSAITFGILQKIGTNEQGKNIYIPGNIQDNPINPNQLPKVLNIDSTSTVTLMPGLPLEKLLPLTSFMKLKKFGVVSEFELTKQSVSAGFDNGLTPEEIFALMEQLSYYELPQNLKINIQEWFASYSSAILYQGFVLKVSDSNIKLVENNPKIKKYIKEKLSDGIFLLNIPIDANISIFKDESGLDFLGNVKTFTQEETNASFPLLRNSKPLSIGENSQAIDFKQISIIQAENLLKELKENLNLQISDSHQKESLEHRINNRLILTKEQLKIAAVRTEILEADGMDFSGKIHLIDASLKDSDMLELQLPDASGRFVTIVGTPLGMSKQTAEAILRFQLEPDKIIENFLVSKITHIKRLRF